MRESERYADRKFIGRNRRLLNEWRKLEERLENRRDIQLQVARRNADGLPVGYLVSYQLRSICGVSNLEHFGERGVTHAPVFATGFQMRIDIPEGYPSVDCPAVFRFLTHDEEGNPIPHPWHPNIRWFGDLAHYLRYDVYHAVSEPPYPEDLKVASWVIRQGEPNEWIYFDSDEVKSEK